MADCWTARPDAGSGAERFWRLASPPPPPPHPPPLLQVVSLSPTVGVAQAYTLVTDVVQVASEFIQDLPYIGEGGGLLVVRWLCSPCRIMCGGD